MNGFQYFWDACPLRRFPSRILAHGRAPGVIFDGLKTPVEMGVRGGNRWGFGGERGTGRFGLNADRSEHSEVLYCQSSFHEGWNSNVGHRRAETRPYSLGRK